LKGRQNLTVAIATLGCKVNQYESAAFVSRFQEDGVEVVAFSQKADIYVVNSCAVTGKAAAQSRQMIRRALRQNPEARIVVTGCYAQIASQDVLEMADQPLCIVGNENKHMLVEIALSDRLCDLEIYMGDISKKREICDLPVRRFAGRTRAYLKIQDGCNSFCSYCVVPFARGRVRSLAPDKVVEQAAVFSQEGYREIVLTGIHVGMYGLDLGPGHGLVPLLQTLAGRAFSTRFRISSLEPNEVSRDLLNLMVSCDQIVPHLHLPLQSGDDATLRRMNRTYGASQFAEVVAMVREALPSAAIGIDLMAGFPGEDERAFAATVDLVERLDIGYLHAFPFSKRPGTLAETMAGQVSREEKERRVAILADLDHKKRTAFYSRQVGTVRQVLAEGSRNQFRLMKGFSENYVPVHFQAPAEVTNQVVPVRIDRVMDRSVFGTLVLPAKGTGDGPQGRLFP